MAPAPARSSCDHGANARSMFMTRGATAFASWTRRRSSPENEKQPVVGQFRFSEVTTEPSAVAPDARITLYPKQVSAHELFYLPTDITKLTLASGATALGSVMNMTFSTQWPDDAWSCSLFIKLTYYQAAAPFLFQSRLIYSSGVTPLPMFCEA